MYIYTKYTGIIIDAHISTVSPREKNIHYLEPRILANHQLGKLGYTLKVSFNNVDSTVPQTFFRKNISKDSDFFLSHHGYPLQNVVNLFWLKKNYPKTHAANMGEKHTPNKNLGYRHPSIMISSHEAHRLKWQVVD